MRILGRTCAAIALVALALPGHAGADFRTLYDDYRADGQIDGCDYDSSELSSGLGEIPADVREYDPGFSDALNSALEQLAAGCETAPDASELAGGITAGDGSPGPSPPHAIATAPQHADGLPAVLVAMMVVLGLCLGAGALLAAARTYGWGLPARRGAAPGRAGGAGDRLSQAVWAVRDRLGF
jgi:hypothetical protein